MRIPTWCSTATLACNGQTLPTAAGDDGYVAVRRTWQAGDQLTLTLPPTPRVQTGDHLNQGKACCWHGPLVLAADAALDPHGNERVRLASTDVAIRPEPATGLYRDWPHAQVFRIATATGPTVLAPFATAGVGTRADRGDDQAQAWDAKAGSNGSRYRVWLRIAGQATGDGNLASDGTESRSRPGNQPGSLIDGGLVVTYDGTKPDQDWYAVTLAQPTVIGRVVFAHGKTFHDGGWFDASAGRPQVQVQAAVGGAWTTVGSLTDYPATTAIDAAKIKEGQRFTCTLATPTTAVAVRVIGKPASGDAPQQAFSSSAGLAVYAR